MFKVPKADAGDFQGRFREIISDPLNLLIKRHPFAGQTYENDVVLHNGIRVPVKGEYAYYQDFSDILVFNRGVHEPLEEFVFQTVLKNLNNQKVSMLELGAYWGHYSMWLLLHRSDSLVALVEPEDINFKCGQINFENNGFKGNFIQDFVGKGHFNVDRYLSDSQYQHLTILHSDIQGYEVEMLEGASGALSQGMVDHIFISTHSENLHRSVERILLEYNYRVEVSSSFERQTTSFDGFIYASHSRLSPIFKGMRFLGRDEINQASSLELITYLSDLKTLI